MFSTFASIKTRPKTRPKMGKLQCISNFKRKEYMPERSPLRRFKGAKKNFSGLKVAPITFSYP